MAAPADCVRLFKTFGLVGVDAFSAARAGSDRRLWWWGAWRGRGTWSHRRGATGTRTLRRWWAGRGRAVGCCDPRVYGSGGREIGGLGFGGAELLDGCVD